MNKKISILGCGWVGKALFDVLVLKHRVICLSRDVLTDEKLGYYNCDVFVIAIPPKEDIVTVLSLILKKSNPIHRLFF
jgi:Trk K+ transport system NAD-binding subunit